MIPSGVQVFVALEPVDMRFGFERLSGWVRERIGYDARGGALFAFVGKRKSMLKIIFFDGTGVCTFQKKLDRGLFSWPEAPSEGVSHLEVDDAVLETLLDGIAIAPREESPAKPRRRRLH
jgi:transposase